MGSQMHQYEVVTQCYVPVGPGLRFKKPGQVVTLDDDDAAELADYVKLAEDQTGVAKRNTKSKVKPKAKSRAKAEPEPSAAQNTTIADAEPEEVSADGSEPGPAVQRAGTEADE